MMPSPYSDEPGEGRYPPPVAPTPPEEEAAALPEEAEDEAGEVSYRGASSDPTFGYLVALALCVGLLPLIPDNTDLRYTLVWLALAGFGALAWLLGNTTRIQRQQANDLAWGVVFGLIIAAPLLAVGGNTLATTAYLLFSVRAGDEMRALPTGSVLALLVFVQPLAETLFFRGMFQEKRPFWLIGLLASLFSALLFFPLLDVGNYPGVGVVIGTALVLMNLVYSYVRRRNGLAAAWLCQIVVNVILLFLPFMAG